MKKCCHCFSARRGAYIIAILGIILGITGLVASSISKAEFIRVSVCFCFSHLRYFLREQLFSSAHARKGESHLTKKVLNAQIKGHFQFLYSGLLEYCLMLKQKEFLRSVIELWR